MTTLYQPKFDADYVDFTSLWQNLRKNKRLIFSLGLLLFVFALIYSFCQPKKYQANLLLQIHQNRHHSIMALPQATQPSALDNLPEQSLAMQIALLRSKFILLPVIHSLGLKQLTKKPESLVFSKMLNRLSIQDLSNSAENNANKAGIIQIAYIGEDPVLTAKILNEIAHVLQQKNRDYKIFEIEMKLAFLKQELPLIQQSLQETETQLNRYKSSTGKMNIPLQTHYFMTRLSDLDKQLQELRFKRSELLQQYTNRYPIIQGITHKMNEIESQRLQAYNELKKLPAEDQAADALARDMHMKNKLYLAVLNQMHELEVAKAGVISDIHVLVAATPPDIPLSMNRGLISLVGFLCGLLLGCLIVIAGNIFSRRIQDPRWLEQFFEIQHLATVPFSRQKTRSGQPTQEQTLEALRYLRTYFQFHLSTSTPTVISFLGLDQKVGKSFISANLAVLFAQLGQKVLLIDANLRESKLHTPFAVTPVPGLSDVLQGRSTFTEALIQAKETPALYFLPAGTHIENPTDLLAGGSLKTLLQKIAAQYPLIFINSASADFPSDCVFTGAAANFNCLIFAAGKHPTVQALSTMKRLKQLGLAIHGSIFNHVLAEETGQALLRRGYRIVRSAVYTRISRGIRASRLSPHAERPYWEKN